MKNDAGKPELMLVPPQILEDIAYVRMYGTKIYKDPENWKNVSVQRYWNAAARHFKECMRDPSSSDAESGLPHRWHLECNLAFIAELEREPPVGNQTPHDWAQDVDRMVNEIDVYTSK